jgi:hypothetical protein
VKCARIEKIQKKNVLCNRTLLETLVLSSPRLF